jgi:hypothetical protein
MSYFSRARSAIANFLGLTDVPSTYTGQGEKVLAVKSDETGIEFVPPFTRVTVSTTAPGAPAVNDLWVDLS